MKQIDLDDLPPRVAQALEGLEAGEELVLVKGGLTVARLSVSAPVVQTESAAELTPEEGMKEVMEQFNAMIHDEF
jgi:antitoxin (DNA-binding transcriptional repressor) of toxin-antitoxin stability system